MSNSYYTHGSFPSTGAQATSASMRSELDLITAGFDKLPTLSGNANKFVVVNSLGTALLATSTLPTATVTDSTFTVQDNADNTKTFQFQASSITTGTQRTYTMPDANTTLVGTDVAQTLTNKTISSSTGAFTTLSATGALTFNTTTNNQSYTTTGAGTITISSGTLGTINNMSIGATTASTGAFTTLAYTGTLTGGTGVIAIGTNQFYKDASGNLGIGTSSPAAKLEVSGSTFANDVGGSTGLLRITSSNNTANNVLASFASTSTANNQLNIISVANNIIGLQAHLWSTGANSDLAIQPNGGNVGIGVTPSAWSVGKVLEIGNTGNAVWGNSPANFSLIENAYYNAGWKYASSNPAATYQMLTNSHIWSIAPSGTAGTAITFTQAMTLDASGRLLIGTTSVSGSNFLQVNSDALINGLTVGRGAGAVSTNTAVGTSALNANTTGAGEVAVGYQALNQNTTGSYNTAIGQQAGYKTTGANNTFVGYVAGYENTTGVSNTAVGFSALFNGAATASSGSYNTAVGQQALNANTTASNNTAVGYQAGYSNTTSAGNTLIGHQAGYTQNNTSGNAYNTFIGYQAGYGVTTGYSNVFIGVNSGIAAGSGSAVTTGYNNVIIGGYTGSAAPISATGNGYIVLSDGAGNVRQTIDSSGNVLIGTTTSPAGSKELVLGGDYIEGVVAIGNSGTAQTISLANGTVQTVTLTGNCTFTMPTAVAGKSFILIVSTGAGSFTGTFTSVKWPNNAAPTLTTTASRWDILTFVSNGTSWYGNFAQAYA